MNRFTVIDCEQRTPEWFQARCGRVTGTGAQDMLTKRKDGTEAAGRANLRTRLITERLTGRSQENDFENGPMREGILYEPRALAAYEALTGALVRRTGFISLNEFAAGCSLDGDTDDFKVIVQAKCPQPTAHYNYLQKLRIPPEYFRTATHEMWVVGAQYYDFISYNETFPEHLQLFWVRADRSEFDLQTYEQEVIAFLKEVDQGVRAMEKWKAPWVK